MESHKGKHVIANRRATPRANPDPRNDVEIVQTTLATSDELAIADDVDFGGDPYNNTGQYCIVKPKLPIAE